MRLELVDTVPLRFSGGPVATNDYLLSPYVYAGGRRIVLRAVPRRDDDPEQKISRAFAGTSSDGVAFALDDEPLLAPGPDNVDRGGVEDPTPVDDGERLHLFYSGWNPFARRSTMLRADGARGAALVKRGPVFGGAAAPEAKEATFARGDDGGWIMLFEIEDDASRIARATAPALGGPWTIGARLLPPRANRFDSWHLSPAGFVDAPDGTRVLIYNGADRDARWQIGWCTFDRDCTRVLQRCDEPVIAAARNAPEQRELAFAASALGRGDRIDVYYSVGDTDPARATLRLL